MNKITTPSPSRRVFLCQAAAALAISRSTFAFGVAQNGGISRPLPLGSIRAGGDLAKRTRQNMGRLQSDIYRPPLLFRQTNWKAWPGDFEGRDLLAITLLSRATGEEPTYFEAMVAAYKPRLNADGYFGPLLDLHAINEQQLSGHGWFLRGLCEYYESKRNPETLAMVQAVIQNLALPLRGKYSTYPIDPALHMRAGGIDGSSTGQHGDWIISTDTGCAFIFLDGLTQAWTLIKSSELKALIDEAIARFLQMDLVAIKAQTHASLTAMRALLRVYGEDQDPALLRAVRERYALYRSVAMTEHYANYNWFGRPESWTEPCAIIDSFMIAIQLWQFTGEHAYLEDAHLIWYNGVGRGLRGNGGFGTDLCAGFKTPFLKVRSYEAYFCCTMRGGEGHARAIQSLYTTRPGELTVPFFSNSEAHIDLGHGPFVLRQETAYPNPGAVRIEFVTAAAPMNLRLFTPRWTSQHRLTVNGRALRSTQANGFLACRVTPKAGDVLQLEHVLRIAPRDILNPNSIAGYYAFEAGPLLLGSQSAEEIHIPRDAKLVAAGPGAYRHVETGALLARIDDLNDSSASPKDPCSRQILFRQS